MVCIDEPCRIWGFCQLNRGLCLQCRWDCELSAALIVSASVPKVWHCFLCLCFLFILLSFALPKCDGVRWSACCSVSSLTSWRHAFLTVCPDRLTGHASAKTNGLLARRLLSPHWMPEIRGKFLKIWCSARKRCSLTLSQSRCGFFVVQGCHIPTRFQLEKLKWWITKDRGITMWCWNKFSHLLKISTFFSVKFINKVFYLDLMWQTNTKLYNILKYLNTIVNSSNYLQRIIDDVVDRKDLQ